MNPSKDGCPRPRIALKLKTKIARIRMNKKSFAPREFSGFLGAATKPLHPSHRLAAARGVVWCWKCGRTATVKPIALTKPCEPLKPHGKATLKRLRQGRPPYNLKNKWPEGDDSVDRRLIVAQSDDAWGTSTNAPRPSPPGSSQL